MEMICIMHQAEPYGHLVVNGKAIQPDTLARMVGCTPVECRRWLTELDDAGVFNRDGDIIISRRMVKDEHIRKLRAEGGKLGGNPALMGTGKVSEKVNGKDNLPPNLQPTPSVFSLQSASKKPRTSFLSGKPDVTDPNAWKFQEPPPAGLEAHFLLAFLNKVTARKYRAVDANITPIRNRLKEASVDEIKSVIAHKANEWSGTDMEKYLRPETLFRASKFASYLGEAA